MDTPRFLRTFIPIAVIVTGLVMLVYAVVQQSYRQGANDPQIQMAEDIAAALTNLIAPEVGKSVDVAHSLAPFIVILDDTGKILVSSGTLENRTPVPPPGVFEYVRAHGEDRVTWQPQPDVRIAAVITRYHGKNDGFVVVGRSLREVEARVAALARMCLLAWAAAMVVALIGCVFASRTRA
jgi:hypothetical protein